MQKFVFIIFKFTPRRLLEWLSGSKFLYSILKPAFDLLTKNDQLKTYQIYDDILIELDISEAGERAVCFNLYEPAITRYFRKIAKEGGIVFDVGAWIGYYTVLAARTADKVIAIEVDAMNCQRIRRNVSLNGFSNVDIINCAIGDKFSDGILLRRKRSYLNKVSPNGEGETITIESLDNQIGKLRTDNVNLIIIDIEGYEYFALKGLQTSLSAGIVKNLICEVHPNMLKEKGCLDTDVLDLLSKYKYKIMFDSKVSNFQPYHIYAKYSGEEEQRDNSTNKNSKVVDAQIR